MNHNTTHINAVNKFSWHRLWLLMRFMWPSVRLQAIIYPSVSLGLGLLLFWLSRYELTSLLGSMAASTLNFMFYLAPVALGFRATRLNQLSLPATAAEKTVAAALWCLIAVPFLTYTPYYICLWIINGYGEPSQLWLALQSIQQSISASLWLSNLSVAVVPAVTCMYVVLSRQKNRTVLGIVWAFVSMICTSILTGICAAVSLLISHRTEFYSLVAQADANTSGNEVGQQLVHGISSMLQDTMMWVRVVTIAYICIMIWLTYRQYHKGQLK